MVTLFDLKKESIMITNTLEKNPFDLITEDLHLHIFTYLAPYLSGQNSVANVDKKWSRIAKDESLIKYTTIDAIIAYTKGDPSLRYMY